MSGDITGRGTRRMLKFTATIFTIFVALLSITPAYSMPDACEHDGNESLQQFTQSGEIGSRFIPKDITIKKISGRYINKIPTVIYYWPIKDKKYVTFGIRCGISCDFKISPLCEISNGDGDWLAFRAMDKIVLYAKYEDFIRK